MGIDGERGPGPGVEDILDGLLVVVVDDQLVHGHAGVARDIEGALDPTLLVTVRRVDHHRHVVLDREGKLGLVGALLGRRDLVVADLADGDDALLQGVVGQDLEDLPREALVVGLLRVEPDGAVVADAELRRAEPLPPDDGGEVVDEGGHVGSRLPQPEGGLDHRANARASHGLVVVRGAAGAVDVRIEEAHGVESSS